MREKQQGRRREREKKRTASCQTAVKWEKFSHVISQTICIKFYCISLYNMSKTEVTMMDYRYTGTVTAVSRSKLQQICYFKTVSSKPVLLNRIISQAHYNFVFQHGQCNSTKTVRSNV